MAFGRRVGESCRPGSVFALCGPVGAGKTHFVRGVVEGLGGHPGVASPTFTLLHEYSTPQGVVLHFDFYRAGSAWEILEAAADELHDLAAVVLVEWADRFPEVLPGAARWVDFLPEDRGRRRIVIRGGA